MRIIATIFFLLIGIASADPADDSAAISALMESSVIQNNKINKLEQAVDALGCKVQALEEVASDTPPAKPTVCPVVPKMTTTQVPRAAAPKPPVYRDPAETWQQRDPIPEEYTGLRRRDGTIIIQRDSGSNKESGNH